MIWTDRELSTVSSDFEREEWRSHPHTAALTRAIRKKEAAAIEKLLNAARSSDDPAAVRVAAQVDALRAIHETLTRKERSDD